MAWTPVERSNSKYSRYYKLQKVCPNETAFTEMMKAFQTPLPAAFRVTFGCDLRQATVDSLLKTASTARSDDSETAKAGAQAAAIADEASSNGLFEPPKLFDWYPSKLAYGWEALVRKEIRTDPKLQEVKKALIGEAERGSIVRQEAVSMVPPIFIDMKSDCAVLDMCAAPGSKTSQLLDLALLSDGTYDSLDCQMPEEAAVIANDVNLSRARMLCHHLQRLGHPASAVTYMDASAYPKAMEERMLFDRVLADVLCSGDGTLRKNVDIWNRWDVKGGLQLHDRQFQILVRGMSLVRPNGIIVYSTCSLNPIEDEAVVAAAMMATGETFELVPLEQEGLSFTPGLSDWIVPNPVSFSNPDMEMVPESFKSVEHFRELNEAMSPELKLKDNLVSTTMFSSYASEAIRAQLSRCGRFLPHQNNSGGFFVAVLRNTSTEPSVKKPRYDDASGAPAVEKFGRRDDPAEFFRMVRLDPAADEVRSILTWYGLIELPEALPPVESKRLVADSARAVDVKSPDFTDPRSSLRDLVKDCRSFPLVRKEGVDKRVYLATPRLIDFCEGARAGTKFLQCGVRAFEKLDEKFAISSGCVYRPMGEAVTWLIPFMRRRLIFMTYESAMDLLEDQMSKAGMLAAEKEGKIASLDPLRRAASDSEVHLMEPGGFVAVCSSDIEAQLNPESPRQLGTLRISCLMSASGNVQPLVRKQVREVLLLLLEDQHRTRASTAQSSPSK